jgi:predicted nucleic acid-binding protein
MSMPKKAAKKTAKEKVKPIQAYAFIDTNIFLDFYRSSNEANLTLLEKLVTVKERIISTYQVEMEFLKNRQTTLLKSIKEVRADIVGSVPAVITDYQTKEALKRLRDDGRKRVATLNSKVGKVLSNPNANDRVYQALQDIFSSEDSHVLTRDMPVRQQIKKRAMRRFFLGYPPRKPEDTSCGDALNWEWIVECSKKLSGRIYIVTRDGDYGCEHDGKYFLNDQLKREFRDRVGNKSIVFTKRLSEALRALEVHVTKKEEEAEAITMTKSITPNWASLVSFPPGYEKTMKDLSSSFVSEELIAAIQKFQSTMNIFGHKRPHEDEGSE